MIHESFLLWHLIANKEGEFYSMVAVLCLSSFTGFIFSVYGIFSSDWIYVSMICSMFFILVFSFSLISLCGVSNCCYKNYEDSSTNKSVLSSSHDVVSDQSQCNSVSSSVTDTFCIEQSRKERFIKS